LPLRAAPPFAADLPAALPPAAADFFDAAFFVAAFFAAGALASATAALLRPDGFSAAAVSFAVSFVVAFPRGQGVFLHANRNVEPPNHF